MKSELFSKYAATYDQHAFIQKISADWILSSLNSDLQKRACILDYGCGTGILTSLLQSRFTEAKLHACDVSKGMLGEARKKTELQDTDFFYVSPNVGIKSILKEHYDLIASNAVFHWVNESDFLKIMAESLNPGGKIVFTAYAPDSFFELTHVLERYFRTKILLPVTYFKDRSSWGALLDSSFKKWTVEKKNFVLEFKDLKHLFRSIKFTGTTSKGLGFPHFWTPGDLKNVENIFLSLYKRVVITYEIFLCTAFKQE